MQVRDVYEIASRYCIDVPAHLRLEKVTDFRTFLFVCNICYSQERFVRTVKLQRVWRVRTARREFRGNCEAVHGLSSFLFFISSTRAVSLSCGWYEVWSISILDGFTENERI